jgi:D-hydroxyproline dehydrogenase
VATPRTAVTIGGGVVGLSVALALQSRGIAVTVFDAPGETPPASWGNAGHIATEQGKPLASWGAILSLPGRLAAFGGPASFPPREIGQWLPFGLRLLIAARPETFRAGKRALQALLREALPAWRRLATQAGAPLLLKEQGHIVAWESLAAAVAGRRRQAQLADGGVRLRDLSRAETALLGAQLKRPPADAIRFERTASVADPGAVLDALRAALLRGGGRIEGRRACLADARRSGADIVVIAAGVRSASLMREIGHRAPIIAERGYHIQSSRTRWPEELPPVVFEERALVATRFISGLRATSFVEFARDDAPADEGKWKRLVRHAAELGLPLDSPPDAWLGSRPTFPDYLPAIGRSTRDPRTLYAFGHQHLGLTLAPVTGEIIAALARMTSARPSMSCRSLSNASEKLPVAPW